LLISFEGVDGSGKSTQISLLKRKLIEAGQEVTVFREPGGTEISEVIRAMLLNPEFKIDPVTELLLFSAARSQLIAEQVRPKLNSDYTVILDRYYDSTTAYQGFGRESVPLENIRQINEIASHTLQPDITFYLRITIEEAERRTAAQQKDRMELSGDAFYKRVIKGFDYLADTLDRFKTIDASLEPEEIHRKIWGEVEAFQSKL